MSRPRRSDDRGIYRSIYTGMLDHEDYQALPSAARLVLLTLRLGIAQRGSIALYSRDRLMAQTGLSARGVEAALRILEQDPSPDRPWIVRDRRIVWVRNGLRFDPTINLDNINNMVGIARDVAGLPRTKTVEAFLAYYPQVAVHIGHDHRGPGGGPPAAPPVAPPPAPGEAALASPSPSPSPSTSPSRKAGDASPAPPLVAHALENTTATATPTHHGYSSADITRETAAVIREHPELNNDTDRLKAKVFERLDARGSR
jgi:hypothetical protein